MTLIFCHAGNVFLSFLNRSLVCGVFGSNLKYKKTHIVIKMKKNMTVDVMIVVFTNV